MRFITNSDFPNLFFRISATNCTVSSYTSEACLLMVTTWRIENLARTGTDATTIRYISCSKYYISYDENHVSYRIHIVCMLIIYFVSNIR